MKMKIRVAIVVLSWLSSGLLNANPFEFKKQLGKVKWIESSIESREVVSGLTTRNSDSRMPYIAKNAMTTGNIDLISYIRLKVDGEDWLKKRTWGEGLELVSRYAESIEVLGKWNSSIKNSFSSYFLHSPDVPYDKITDWHVGFSGRGIQGTLLKAIALYDPKSFKEIVGMMSGPSLSLSKKRTIVWAMRYDHSGFSERALQSRVPQHAGVPGEDIKETLKVLSLKK